MATRRPYALVAGAALVTAALVAAGCAQPTRAVEVKRDSESGYYLIPSDTPTAREWRNLPPPGTPPDQLDVRGVPGGKRVYQRWCASCHGEDGRGNPNANPPVPDLVTFGVPLPKGFHFIYNPAEIPVEDQARIARFKVVNAIHQAIQEAGKARQTPLQWFESVSGDPARMRNARGEPITAHIEAPFNREENGVSRQARWDAVYYLWSLSEDVQIILDGGEKFQVNCNVCHGRVALGDGHLAHHFEPKPRAFNKLEWMSDKPNQRLFDSITLGRVYTGMPPWEHLLTPDVRWRIIEYLRTFTYKYPYDFVWKKQDG